ncbi:MAG TPA: hypothetical protein VET23_14470 [Chitinophagaceae bacterium]|nr:hypothetical protein [Chitinophagaceae bacterium]
MKKFVLLQMIIALPYFSQAKNYFCQQDTLPANDSAIDQTECYEKFFQKCEPISAPGKTMLILKNKKTVSLNSFFKYSNADTSMGIGTQQGLADLDNDGKKELVLYDYTGGAHCCDEFYIFKNIAPNKYQYVAKTFAGDVCITDKNEFIYDFYQQYGYFFTCFACAYADSSDAGPQPVHGITLKYSKGKLVVVPGDKELKSTINDNLGKLREQPYQKLQDEADQDNGLRKEFALNLAVYYYSFGRNLAGTKQLFDKYYHFPDAKEVWTRFVQILNGIRKDSDF